MVPAIFYRVPIAYGRMLEAYYNSACAQLSESICSKLMMSLVNISLKFQFLISQIRQYFLLKKCEKLLHFSFFQQKNIRVFDYKVVKHFTSWPLNGLIKLTMLWTNGPRWFFLFSVCICYALTLHIQSGDFSVSYGVFVSIMLTYLYNIMQYILGSRNDIYLS